MIGEAISEHIHGNKPDFASKASGAYIVTSKTSPSYSVFRDDSYFSWMFGRSNGHPPSVILQPDNSIGNCWAFSSSHGHVTIGLSRLIYPTSFSLEHIHPDVAYDFGSAPKDIRVWGLANDTAKPISLATYTYEKEKGPKQHFHVASNVDFPIPLVILEVLSNHGNNNYTCIYRFKVHGTLVQ